MEENKLIPLIAEFILSNWQWLIGILSTIVIGSISLTWLVSNHIHRREIDLLKYRVEEANSRFTQLETIMEKRIEVAEAETEKLYRKLIKQGRVPELEEKTVILHLDEHEDIVSEFVENEDIFCSLEGLWPTKENENNLNLKEIDNTTSRLVERTSSLIDFLKLFNRII